MYQPMSKAIGMVAPTVNVPQGLPLSALTMTSPSTAMRMTMISSTPLKRREAAEDADLLARHLPERLAVAPQRADEDEKVLHGAAQDDADDDPQRPRQVAELRAQRRPDQRTGAGDGGEVVPEDDPAVGRNEVVAVVDALGGRAAADRRA